MWNDLPPDTWTRPSFTVAEAAHYSGLSERTIRSYIERQTISFGVKHGGGWLFSYSDIAKFVILKELNRRARFPAGEAAKIAVQASELAFKTIASLSSVPDLLAMNLAVLWDEAGTITVMMESDEHREKIRLLIPAGRLMFQVYQTILFDQNPMAAVFQELNAAWFNGERG